MARVHVNEVAKLLKRYEVWNEARTAEVDAAYESAFTDTSRYPYADQLLHDVNADRVDWLDQIIYIVRTALPEEALT